MTPFDKTHSHAPLKSRAQFLFWGLVVVITVLALYPRLTLPEPGLTEGVTHSYNHILAFVTLVVVGAVAWGLCRQLVVGLAIYAIALELAQMLSPGRQTTLGDMAASLAGVAIGVALAQAFGRAKMRLSDRRLGTPAKG